MGAQNCLLQVVDQQEEAKAVKYSRGKGGSVFELYYTKKKKNGVYYSIYFSFLLIDHELLA